MKSDLKDFSFYCLSKVKGGLKVVYCHSLMKKYLNNINDLKC